MARRQNHEVNRYRSILIGEELLEVSRIISFLRLNQSGRSDLLLLINYPSLCG